MNNNGKAAKTQEPIAVPEYEYISVKDNLDDKIDGCKCAYCTSEVKHVLRPGLSRAYKMIVDDYNDPYSACHATRDCKAGKIEFMVYEVKGARRILSLIVSSFHDTSYQRKIVLDIPRELTAFLLGIHGQADYTDMRVYDGYIIMQWYPKGLDWEAVIRISKARKASKAASRARKDALTYITGGRK